MKVFKIYFLALLLIAAFPLTAEEVSEEDAVEPEKTEEKAEAEEEKAEAEEEKAEAEEEKVEEKPEKPEKVEKAVVEKPAEEKPAEPKVAQEKPAEPKVAEEKPAEPKVAVKIEKEEAEKEDGEKKDEKEQKEKKFSVSVTNGFSHGLAKERKSFAYNLSLGASYTLPWKIGLSAGVGLNALYRYDLAAATPTEDGGITTDKVEYGQFDGTPLNIGLSRPFPLFWKIGGSLGINAGLPFTSTELWEQYNIYTMLTVDLKLSRGFKIAKETSLRAGFGFSYTKTFAKNDYALDDYQNDLLSMINEHNIGLGLSLALSYKDFSLMVRGGYSISKNYSSGDVSFSYGDDGDLQAESDTVYQPWTYVFGFSVVASYTLKEWNFGIGAMTNAPEYESGNYAGYNTVDGDKDVINPSSNYPFKAKYTRIFANIGYSYSF